MYVILRIIETFDVSLTEILLYILFNQYFVRSAYKKVHRLFWVNCSNENTFVFSSTFHENLREKPISPYFCCRCLLAASSEATRELYLWRPAIFCDCQQYRIEPTLPIFLRNMYSCSTVSQLNFVYMKPIRVKLVKRCRRSQNMASYHNLCFSV